MSDVTIEYEYGMVLVRDRNLDEFERRWWFHETERGRLSLREEVAHDEAAEARECRNRWEADVPSRVVNALSEEGYDTVLDSKGREL